MARTYTVEVPLRWGDMDAYGHVNNVTMMQVLEEARVALFGPPPSSGEPAPVAGEGAGSQPAESQPGRASAQLPLFESLPAGTQALVAENHVKYRSPLAYRGVPVRVQMQVSKVTAASLVVGYELYDPVTGVHCVSASTTLAFFNVETGSLVRLSAEQREQLAA
ncbi:MAG: thioesterase family protein [Rothia sp. (in: high G+C Gram-positive bacteria)]|uniref:acyl-CoA thioesterase n=1 Tax=Rothia sp. (in: high G+C Gram-positive bacteria) TaxID=1885016 RepID=UPI00270933F2|nr:thioesterase family protein [Rothia sp. (in: high G+C Gram-positive bacteria)]